MRINNDDATEKATVRPLNVKMCGVHPSMSFYIYWFEPLVIPIKTEPGWHLDKTRERTVLDPLILLIFNHYPPSAFQFKLALMYEPAKTVFDLTLTKLDVFPKLNLNPIIRDCNQFRSLT